MVEKDFLTKTKEIKPKGKTEFKNLCTSKDTSNKMQIQTTQKKIFIMQLAND